MSYRPGLEKILLVAIEHTSHSDSKKTDKQRLEDALFALFGKSEEEMAFDKTFKNWSPNPQGGQRYKFEEDTTPEDIHFLMATEETTKPYKSIKDLAEVFGLVVETMKTQLFSSLYGFDGIFHGHSPSF